MLRGPHTPAEFMAKPARSIEDLDEALVQDNPEAPYAFGDSFRSAYLDEEGNEVHSVVTVGVCSIARVFFKEGK